jgi:hypothetical protein
MTQTADILRKARSIIEKPENWTQGTFARDESGNAVNPRASAAVCYCSRGALNHVTGGDGVYDGEAYDVLLSLLSDDYLGVADFNDTNTHAEVLALFDRAIDRAESEAA